MKTKIPKAALVAALVAGICPVTVFAAEVRHDFWPGRDKVIPHVSGDEQFSNTYRYWKDEMSLDAAVTAGLMSHEMNYKDFRWREKSLEGEMLLGEGQELFNTANEQGQSCASCHGADGKELEGTYARMPKYNERLKRVVVGPTQIRICAEERLGRKDWGEDTRPNTLLAFYLASLSDGEIIDVDVNAPGPVKDSYERGRDLFFKRVGHFHFACASCHTPPSSGNYLRGQRPTTFFGDAAQYPIYHFPYQLAGDNLSYIFTMQHQIRSCQQLSRMYQGREGSAPMTDIETFLRASANGYPISVPVSEYNMNTDYLERSQQVSSQ
ncbi:MAG: sulfur oxidation c-type cytochrome SoxA [Gammaproteobacteria bacterium]|nr:sulfur oxidation c-type cytochrome SoxA [Gammaproteobacteria bacterium]